MAGFSVEKWAEGLRDLKPTSSSGEKKRRWGKPKETAKQFADEMRARKHLNGPKKGQDLTTQEFLYRSGYMQARRDSAEMYKYKQRKQGK